MFMVLIISIITALVSLVSETLTYILHHISSAVQNFYSISMLHFTASYLSSRLGIVCQTYHTFVPITCSSLVAVARYR